MVIGIKAIPIVIMAPSLPTLNIPFPTLELIFKLAGKCLSRNEIPFKVFHFAFANLTLKQEKF